MKRGRPPVCIHCGSSNSRRKGLRKTKQLGVRQIRLCKDCGRKFTPRHQLPRGPAEPEDHAARRSATAPGPAMPEPQPQAPAVEAARPDGPIA